MKVHLNNTNIKFVESDNISEIIEFIDKYEYIDISDIPTCLGDDFGERLKKWLIFRQQGIELINSRD